MASAVEMGQGYVTIGLRNRIDQGARGVQASLDKIGTQTAKLGLLVSATSATILTAPVMAASRLQETMSKFDVVFGDSADEMRQWSTLAADALGTSRREMEYMLGSMQDLLVPMGVVPDHASNMSATLSQLAVDLGSFNNVGTDEAFTDLMAAMTGSGEVMKKYGVILSETAVKQEILNMGLDPKTADNATKAQARLNIIMRGTTAAQGDAIRTSSEFANQLKRFWAVVEDVSGAVGGTLVDGLAGFVGIAVNAGSAVKDFVDDNRDLVAVATAGTLAIGIAGAGLVGFGVAAKLAASGLGVFVTASTVGAAVIGTAWSAVGLAMSALQFKASIGAAVVSTVWKYSAGIVSTAWSAVMATLSTAFSSAAWLAGAAVTTAAWVASAGAIAVAIFGLDAVLITTATAATVAWGASAGTIGTLWTAVSGLLAALSISTSGAWAAGAALVSAGWAGVSFVLTALSGPAGLLAGLATIATAAWTAGAGLVGTAWTALTGAFAASGLAGVTAAGLASAAWSALGAVMAVLAFESTISSVVISTAWSAAAALASLAWSGFTAVLSAALTPAALMTAA
ncbi:membrane protein, partial [Rhodopirellula maiorica SM1]